MHVIITGTSTGLGKAIAESFLEKGYSVTGIGRRHTIVHSSYTACNCDLSDHTATEQLQFGPFKSPVLLINNAGILGNVQRLSDQEHPDIGSVMAVNVIAPALLMQKLARACADDTPLTVVNISSGAAARAIPSWSSYCASKAALALLSETFYREEQEKGRSTRVYCVAPGIVDTPMQQQIRSVKPEDFSASATFHGYFDNGELITPEEAAGKLHRLLERPYSGTVYFSLRDIM